ERRLPAHRLPGHPLLRGAEDDVPAGEPRRGGSRAAGDVREARHLARRAEAPDRRRRGCGVRQRVGRHHLQEDARGSGRDLLLVLRRGRQPPRPGGAVPGLGRPLHRQLLRHAQLRALQRRLLRLRARGRALPEGAADLLHHQRCRDRAGRALRYVTVLPAPQRDGHASHAALVGVVALEGAEIRYSTVQSWYPGIKEGKGGIYNFVTKRGACRGRRSKISWTQVETGSAITWKYPSRILHVDDSVCATYSVAVTNHQQRPDTRHNVNSSGSYKPR